MFLPLSFGLEIQQQHAFRYVWCLNQVFIQSDVFEVAVDMRNQFDGEAETLKHVDDVDSSVLCDGEGWLLRNPMGIRTEREIHAEAEGAKIYRRMYQKADIKLN